MAKQTAKLQGTETAPAKRIRPQHDPERFRNGVEYPDPTPVAPPVGFIKQPTLAETMRQMIRSEELKKYARESGAETFEESEDFDVGDDFDPMSPHEELFDPHAYSDHDPQQAFTDGIARGIVKAMKEEWPAGSTPSAPPPEAQPTEQPQDAPQAPQGGGSPPSTTNPLTSFFQKK